MTRVLTLVNNSTSTSIPIEISAKINKYSDIEVIVGSFYENTRSEFDEDIEQYDLKILPIGAANRTDISAYRKLLKVVKNESIDVLHTHHNSVGSIARGLFSLSDIVIVNTEHRNHQSFSLLQRVVNFPTFPTVDEMVSNSKCTQSSFYWYEDMFAYRSTHNVVYNGVDLKRIDRYRKQTSNNNPKKLQIVSVGRLESIKNHKVILQSFSNVLDRYPESKLVIVGGGPRKDHLQSLASDLNIRDSVQFTGLVPRNEVYRILSQSDLFVIASKSEGFCVAVVEAMACELPVVASDIETLHEVIGEKGIYARPDHPDEFTAAIDELIDDDTRRQEIGKKGRERVINNFRLEKTAEEYYKIYKRAVEDE